MNFAKDLYTLFSNTISIDPLSPGDIRMSEGGESFRKAIEKLTKELKTVAKTLEQIPTRGFIRELLILYIHEKTGLGKRKIEYILDIIRQFAEEILKEGEE